MGFPWLKLILLEEAARTTISTIILTLSLKKIFKFSEVSIFLMWAMRVKINILNWLPNFELIMSWEVYLKSFFFKSGGNFHYLSENIWTIITKRAEQDWSHRNYTPEIFSDQQVSISKFVNINEGRTARLKCFTLNVPNVTVRLIMFQFNG